MCLLLAVRAHAQEDKVAAKAVPRAVNAATTEEDNQRRRQEDEWREGPSKGWLGKGEKRGIEEGGKTGDREEGIKMGVEHWGGGGRTGDREEG